MPLVKINTPVHYHVTKYIICKNKICQGPVSCFDGNRRFHVYQHVTSFSHMRSALVGKRTTATSFHRQNMCSVCANTLEYWHYWSKYTNILNPTVREDRSVVCWQVWQIVRSVLGLKKRHDELSRSAVCWQTPRALASLYYCGLHEISSSNEPPEWYGCIQITYKTSCVVNIYMIWPN